jgi:hypothetical protein
VKRRLERRKMRILIDSGFDFKCISEKFMKSVRLPKKRSKKGILIRAMNGRDIERIE